MGCFITLLYGEILELHCAAQGQAAPFCCQCGLHSAGKTFYSFWKLSLCCATSSLWPTCSFNNCIGGRAGMGSLLSETLHLRAIVTYDQWVGSTTVVSRGLLALAASLSFLFLCSYSRRCIAESPSRRKKNTQFSLLEGFFLSFPYKTVYAGTLHRVPRATWRRVPGDTLPCFWVQNMFPEVWDCSFSVS